MKATLEHPELGTILYEESFWTGKRSVSINGVKLKKTGRNTFGYQTQDAVKTILVQGNTFTGAKLGVDGQLITVVPAAKWYEIVIFATILTTVMLWGNISVLNSLFPIVGGALGGALAAVAAYGSLALSRLVKKWWQKVLIGVGMLAAAMITGFALILLIALIFG